MREVIGIMRALGDENRVRALLALRNRELCLCQLIEFLGLAPSTVSKHMSILKQARLVDSRKSGRWVYYRLAGHDSPPQVQGAVTWLFDSLSGDKSLCWDEQRLQDILKIDPNVLCSMQGR
ncbi:MAG: metalloregulator ArsR/SmtB family transcription factor [Pseudomonadota bacterium]